MRIVTVLRSGGEFTPRHVKALQLQVEQHAPWADFQCLSDVGIPGVDCVALKTNWPGWWAKMELFNPALPGDLLFMDLDTVLVGSLSDLLEVGKLTVLRDFYRDGVALKAGLGSGLMFLPEAARDAPWETFVKSQRRIMASYHKGDQQLLEEVWGIPDVQVWQNVVPGQVVSYKRHCCANVLGKGPQFRGVPETARVICYHGKPRPWSADSHFQGLYK